MYSRLNSILGAVAGVIEKTVVLDPIISEIKADIADGHAAIDGAVERLKVRKGYSEESQREQASEHEYLPVGASAAATPRQPAPPASTSSYTNY